MLLYFVGITFTPTELAAVQLTIIPAGPVLEGTTIVIQCHVSNKDDLDIVRLVHQTTDGAIVDHEITTNGYLERPFSTTGRYKVIGWNETAGLVQLQIESAFHFTDVTCIMVTCIMMINTMLFVTDHS